MKRKFCASRATLERASEHPLAAAILAAAKERGLAPGNVADFRSLTGKGVTGIVDGRSRGARKPRPACRTRNISRRISTNAPSRSNPMAKR